jgi:hypothetical protein
MYGEFRKLMMPSLREGLQKKTKTNWNFSIGVLTHPTNPPIGEKKIINKIVLQILNL